MFWPIPNTFLSGASAAAGIAAINSIGNLSGFAGPYAMGYLKDRDRQLHGGPVCCSAGCRAARRDRRRHCFRISGDVSKKKKKNAAKRSRRKHRSKIVAADLFCGAGGLTNGLAKAGIDVRIGVDIDPACEYPYTANNDSEFLLKSVVNCRQRISTSEMNAI